MPEMVPVARFRAKPGGKLPDSMLKVTGAVPPVVCMNWLYPGLFCVQSLRDVVVIATAVLESAGARVAPSSCVPPGSGFVAGVSLVSNCSSCKRIDAGGRQMLRFEAF